MMRSIALAAAILLYVADVAISAPLPFTLDVLATGKDTISLSAPAGGGRVPLTLIQTALPSKPPTLDVMLSQFVGEQGNSVGIDVLIEPAGQPAPMHRVKVTGAALPLQLLIPDLPTPGKYTGTLTLLAEGYDPLVLKLVLVGASVFRPATLVVDRGALTTSVTTCPWVPCLVDKPTAVSVHVADKNRLWPLDAVTYRQEPSAKTSEFDADRNLAFTFNGNPVARLGDPTSDRQPRVVPRGQAATLGMLPQQLRPGEYNATLRFQAFNSVDDDGQKLLLTVLVRHCIFWAIVVLLLALGVSFLVTKVLVMLRQRLALLARIRDLRPAWLGTMQPVLPVVWTRAMLREAKGLSGRYWLTGQHLIDTRLNQVAGVLSVLEKVRDLHVTFDGAFFLNDFVKVRAITALGRIVSRMGAGALTDAKATALKAELDGLAAWTAQTAQSYWADVVKAAQGLLDVADPQQGPQPGRAAVAPLKTELATAIQTVPATLKDMTDIEAQYARLKVLWERRHVSEFADLLALQTQNKPLSDLFAAADQAAWGRLQDDNARQIVLPQDTGAEPLEAYEPLTFSLETPTDPAIAETYLFLHGLTYAWTITLGARKRDWKTLWFKRRSPLTLGAVSTEPHVVVYAPEHGLLSAEVTVKYKGASITAQKQASVKIVKSEDFTVDKGFERVEVLSFAIAGAIALVSGLSLLYAKNPTFGTMSDYLGLFLWGIGVDQSKNLVQALQMTAPPAKVT